LTRAGRRLGSIHVPPRRPTSKQTDEILARLAALEERVTCLEQGRASPGDGRAATPRPLPKVKRCPGCGLPLRRKAGRCAACGRPLDA